MKNTITIQLRKSKIDTDRPWYFVGKSGNGQVVFVSQNYTRKENAKKTIDRLIFCGWNIDYSELE